MKLTALCIGMMLVVAPAFAADQAGEDTSTGAKEQSSMPPGSDAETANKPLPSPGGERSSAPEGSSASDPAKPNPALGSSDQDTSGK
jgi:hypothetical protein